MIEEALRALLERLVGSWNVRIEAGAWWNITVYNAWGFRCKVFVDSPEKQTREFICQRLQAAIDAHSRKA